MFESLIIGAHLYSIHPSKESWMNDANIGIYACAGPSNQYCAGTFKNTLSKQSFWAGYTLRHRQDSTSPLEFALTLGVVNGYKPIKVLDTPAKCFHSYGGKACTPDIYKMSGKNSSDWRLLISPSIAYSPVKNLNLRVAYQIQAIHFSIEHKF